MVHSLMKKKKKRVSCEQFKLLFRRVCISAFNSTGICDRSFMNKEIKPAKKWWKSLQRLEGFSSAKLKSITFTAQCITTEILFSRGKQILSLAELQQAVEQSVTRNKKNCKDTQKIAWYNRDSKVWNPLWTGAIVHFYTYASGALKERLQLSERLLLVSVKSRILKIRFGGKQKVDDIQFLA